MLFISFIFYLIFFTLKVTWHSFTYLGWLLWSIHTVLLSWNNQLLVNVFVFINLYHDYDFSDLCLVACCVLHVITSYLVQSFTYMHSRSQCCLSSIIIDLIYTAAAESEIHGQNQQQEKQMQTKENREEGERTQLKMEEVERKRQIENQRKAEEAR